MSVLTSRRADAVMILAIDRPAAANAIDTAVSDAIVAALAEAAGGPDIAGVVLTATGERVFCAGIDLKNSDNLPPLRLAEQRSASLDHVLCAILAFPKPLVVAVNGAAIGAGFMLALLADVAVAADTARFALPEIDHGMPTPIGLALIQEVAAGALAANLVLLGRSMTAAEAERHGLVTCVAGGDLQAHATEIAQDLARKPALAFAQNKEWLQRRRRAAIAAATRDSAAYRLRSLQAAEA